MSMESEQTPQQPSLTAAILTYNGDKYLRRILDMLTHQEYDGSLEILVIDSGSTDETLDIVRAYSGVRLHQIANTEFGHGKTRNLAAQLATGDIIAFLTHDAIPLTLSWASEIVAPFALDSKIVAVMGKQEPRYLCVPLIKYEIRGVFAQFGPDFGTSVFYKDSFASNQGVLDALAFYSDVNSAARRDFLVNVIPYRDVRYAEDQLFGRDVIDAGYHKAYAPRASVEHSNDLTLSEYGRRIFDETVGLRQIGFAVNPINRSQQLRLTVRGIGGDTLRLLRDKGFSWKRRAYWLVFNPSFHVRKWSRYRVAAAVDLNDAEAIKAGSLEHSRIKSA
jgi:rhamnosyltransferase